MRIGSSFQARLQRKNPHLYIRFTTSPPNEPRESQHDSNIHSQSINLQKVKKRHQKSFGAIAVRGRERRGGEVPNRRSGDRSTLPRRVRAPLGAFSDLERTRQAGETFDRSIDRGSGDGKTRPFFAIASNLNNYSPPPRYVFLL